MVQYIHSFNSSIVNNSELHSQSEMVYSVSDRAEVFPPQSSVSNSFNNAILSPPQTCNTDDSGSVRGNGTSRFRGPRTTMCLSGVRQATFMKIWHFSNKQPSITRPFVLTFSYFLSKSEIIISVIYYCIQIYLFALRDNLLHKQINTPSLKIQV